MPLSNKDQYRLLCREESSIPIFSRDWWLDTICGDAWDVLLYKEKARICAAFPFYSPVPGIISMPPFTQTLGPWIAPEAEDTKYTTRLSRRQIICLTFIDELKPYTSFLQNFSPRITDWLPFYWHGYSQTTRYTYILNDIRDHARIWNGMSTNIRRNIAKAGDKCGVDVRCGIPTEDLIRMITLAFGRQNLKPKHIPILERLVAEARRRNQGDIWGGYDRAGNLHAAAFIVWQDSSAYYIAGGGDPSLRESGAHSLVLWDAIRSVSVHAAAFDFEGSMLPGVERFFREFGAEQTPYFAVSKGKLGLLDRLRIKLRTH